MFKRRFAANLGSILRLGELPPPQGTKRTAFGAYALPRGFLEGWGSARPRRSEERCRLRIEEDVVVLPRSAENGRFLNTPRGIEANLVDVCQDVFRFGVSCES